VALDVGRDVVQVRRGGRDRVDQAAAARRTIAVATGIAGLAQVALQHLDRDAGLFLDLVHRLGDRAGLRAVCENRGDQQR